MTETAIQHEIVGEQKIISSQDIKVERKVERMVEELDRVCMPVYDTCEDDPTFIATNMKDEIDLKI